MGNVLFRCCSTRHVRRLSNRRRRGMWEKLLSICGFEALGSPPKRSRRSNNHKASNKDKESYSGGFVETMCGIELRDSAKQRRSVKLVPKSRSTSRASIPLPKEDPQESLLRPVKEGWRANSPGYASSPGGCSPEAIKSSFNQHCYKQLHGNSSVSRSSQLSGGSPGMSRMSLKQQYFGEPSVDRPPSSGSHSHSPRDLTRMAFNRHSSQLRHVDSATSSSVSGPISENPDTMRMSFNQHCYQQLHPVPAKKCRSPRRNTKPGSGKSSRRKRTGMRSPSHRTSTSKSPARNISGRTEDNEEKRNGGTAPSRKSPSPRSLGKILKESEENCSEGAVQPDGTSNSKTLATAFTEGIEEKDNLRDNRSINGTRSQSHKTPYTKSPGRPLNYRIHDYEQSSSPYYKSFNGSQAGIVSPISRRVALSLIGRQKAFGSRRSSMRPSEHGCRQWKPTLESISETF